MALILDGTDGIGISDGTQPLDPASLNAVIQALIPTGTKMMFVQTAAPTGWTKDTTHNNKALRVVSGTAGSGGTVAFTTAFSSKAVSGSIGNTTAGGTVNNTTLSTGQIPAHAHSGGTSVNGDHSHSVRHVQGGTGTGPCVHAGGGNRGDGNGSGATTFGAGNHSHSFTTNNTGSSEAHNHSFSGAAHNHTFTGTAIDMAVQYVDVIIATKD